MAKTALQGYPVNTNGELPAINSKAADFTVVGADLSLIKLADFAGKNVVLNIFPSIDTGVCATSVRTFNQKAVSLENTVVLCLSRDLPFALGRFCAAEGIENVTVASDFRHGFGDAYGVTLAEGPMEGLLARAVVVLDDKGEVKHVELVAEITQEPSYDAALAVLQ